MRSSISGTLLALVLLLSPTMSHAASACPESVAFDPAPNAGSADTGFTGIGHDRPIYGNVLGLALDCAVATQPCGPCPITGLLPDADGMFQRCRNDTSVLCTAATEVADCGAPATCGVFLTVPQSVAVGGVAACYTHELTSPPTGSVIVESGAFSVDLTYQSTLYFGMGATTGCPKCVDDPTANDGVRGGTCSSGTRTGLTCDGHGPAATGYEDLGTSSFDCPQVPGAILSIRQHGPLTFSTGTQNLTLAATSPSCGSAAPGKNCFCQTCNNPAEEACTQDSDCPDPLGPIEARCGGNRCVGGTNEGTPCVVVSECPMGECKRAGEPSRPSSCLDSTTSVDDCVDTPPLGDGKGECAAGPTDQHCSNHLNRGCTGDADCDGVPGACVTENRACFTTSGTIGDVLGVTGVATPPATGVSEPAELGMLACLEPTDSNAVNNVLGLPGLTRNVHVGRLVFSESVEPVPTPVPTSTPIPAACSAAPAVCRPPFVLGKSKVQLVDEADDAKDRLDWKWSHGSATSLPELGDPVTTDAYALCLYEDTTLRATLQVPAGGTCRGKPCWRASSAKFQYSDRDGAADGITKLTLRAGSDGRASIQAKGRGLALPMPAIGMFTGAVSVQLRNRTTGLCWDAVFAPPFQKQTAELLKDKDG